MKTNKLALIAGASVLSIGAIAAIALSGNSTYIGHAEGTTYEYKINTNTLGSYLPGFDYDYDEPVYTNFTSKSVKGGTGTMLLSAYDIADGYGWGEGLEFYSDSWIKNDTALIGWESFKLESNYLSKFRVYYSDVAEITADTPYITPTSTGIINLPGTFSYFKLASTGVADADAFTLYYSCADNKLKAPQSMVGKWVGDLPLTLEFYSYDLGMVSVDANDAASPYILTLDEIDGRNYHYLDDDGNKLNLYIPSELSSDQVSIYKSGTKIGAVEITSNYNSVHREVHSTSVTISEGYSSVGSHLTDTDEYTIYHGSSNAGLNKMQLHAVVAPSNSSYSDITWSIDSGDDCLTLSNESKGYVDVTGTSAGVAMLKAETEDGVAAYVYVNVCDPVYTSTLSIQGQGVSGGNLNLDPNGADVQLTAKMSSGVTESAVTWASSDEAVVKVSSSGKLSIKGSGTADVTVTAKKSETQNIVATLHVTVAGESSINYAGDWKFPSGDYNDDIVVADDGQSAVFYAADGSHSMILLSATADKASFYLVDDSEAVISLYCEGGFTATSDECLLTVESDPNEYISGCTYFYCEGDTATLTRSI